jgi:hypothetical protein
MTARRIATADYGTRPGLSSGLHHQTARERAAVRAEWAEAHLDPDMPPEARDAAIAAHFDTPKPKTGSPWRGWNSPRRNPKEQRDD